MPFFESILANVIAAILIFFLGALATALLLRFTARGLEDTDLEEYLLAETAKACGEDRDFLSEFVVKTDIRFFGRHTIVFVGYSKPVASSRYDGRHAVFFDIGRPSLLDKLISRSPGYRLSAAFNLVMPEWAGEETFFIPTGHRRLDLNNDGKDELVLDFTCTFADRLSKFFAAFYLSGDSWAYIGSPDLREFLNGFEDLKNTAIYQEEYEALDVSWARRFYAYSNGAFYAFGRRALDQDYRLFVGVPANHGEATLSPHRVSLFMLRCQANRFVLDENWNHGRPRLTAEPKKQFSEQELDAIVDEGYENQQIGKIEFYRRPMFGKLKDIRQR